MTQEQFEDLVMKLEVEAAEAGLDAEAIISALEMRVMALRETEDEE